MGTNEGAGELSGPEKVVEGAASNQETGSATIPSARDLEL